MNQTRETAAAPPPKGTRDETHYSGNGANEPANRDAHDSLELGLRLFHRMHPVQRTVDKAVTARAEGNRVEQPDIVG